MEVQRGPRETEAHPHSARDFHNSTDYASMIKFDGPTIKACLGEFLVTYLFIFTVCANGLNEARLKVNTAAVSSGISAGFAGCALIFAFGGISGAHFNPAVTLAAIVGRKIDPVLGLIYIVLQVFAGIFAVSSLVFLFPGDGIASSLVLKPGADVNNAQAFVFEFILTFILVFVIYCTAMGVKLTMTEADIESQTDCTELIASNKQKINFAAIAIGFTIGFLCFLGGSVSGGCFNPTRATGPAILSGDISYLWLYWVADCLGAIFAALLFTKVFSK